MHAYDSILTHLTNADFCLCKHYHSPNKGSRKRVTRLCFYFSAQNLLSQHNGLFFAPLALVVVNDDSARCKKMAAMAIKALLNRLDLNHQNTLFSLVNTWLNAEKVQIKFYGNIFN